MDAPALAVVDVETTGIYPGGSDRIIEIAVLRARPDGSVLSEYSSLVNPQRDVGPTHIHGIRARDVRDAPTFGEIAGDVLSLLGGAILVAHNASFDARFLRAEFERADCPLPGIPQLCTLRLSRLAEAHLPSRRLPDLCRHFGVPLECAHSALDDAKATAGLMAACLTRIGGLSARALERAGTGGEPVSSEQWPVLAARAKACPRGLAARRDDTAPSYIARLVAALPSASESRPEVDAYCALLDRVLEDRRVTAAERDALLETATDLGLSRDHAASVHRDYLRHLLRVALEDDVITEAEETDLDEVRLLLGISEAEYAAMRSAAAARDEPAASPCRVLAASTEELRGKTICFTGALQCVVHGERAERSVAEQVAADHGMCVKKNVSKKLDFLVVADPDTISGKGRKAREYGVRILAEPVFWRMVGVQVE